LGSELDRGEYKILGGKTGYISESGYNLVLRVARGKDEIVVVVLGSTSGAARFSAAKALALWAFQNFRWDTLAK
jgi:D-alanyl-D-alanine carboxypeptidase